MTHINGAPRRFQAVAYTIACVLYVIVGRLAKMPLITTLPDVNDCISLTIVSFICMVAMYYHHTLSSQFLTERSTTRLGHFTSLLSVILLDFTQRKHTVEVHCQFHSQVTNTLLICSVIISIGFYLLNLPQKRSKKEMKSGSSLLRVLCLPRFCCSSWHSCSGPTARGKSSCIFSSTSASCSWSCLLVWVIALIHGKESGTTPWV